MPGAFAFDIEAQEALEQIAIDSVPAGERVMLLDGEHVLTGHLRTTEPACVVVRICGVEAHTCSVGRFTTSEPLGGWRDPAYNDQSWPSLRWSAQAPRGLVPAEPLEDDCPLWLRLRFSTRLGRPQ